MNYTKYFLRKFCCKEMAIPMLFLIVANLLAIVTNVKASQNPQPVTKKTVVISLAKDKDSFIVQQMRVIMLESGYSNDYREYKDKSYNGTVFSFKGVPLGSFSTYLDLPTIIADFESEEAGPSSIVSKLEAGIIEIHIPYFPNGKYADIYDPEGKKVLTIDLSSKATCNENETCDRPVEDSINCEQDCKNGQPIIDRPIPASKKLQPPQQSILWKKALFIISSMVLVLIIVAAGWLFLKRFWLKNNQS